MKRLPVACFVLFLVLTAAAPAPAAEPPLRGKALYDAWDKLEIAKTAGTTRVTWLPDGQGWLETGAGQAAATTAFYKVDPRTGKKSPLFSPDLEQAIVDAYNRLTGKAAAGLPFSSFSYLPDNAGLHFSVGPGQDFVFLFKERLLRRLERPAGAPAPSADSIPPEFMRFMRRGPAPVPPGYSPDFTKYVYAKDNDLWIYDLATKKEEPLTSGGSETLMNGKTDWVYPEELTQREAFWWSPDGGRVAYLQFDERAVFDYPIIHDLTPAHKPVFEAPLELERYPNSGEPNPTVKLFVLGLADRKPVEIKTDSGPDAYITRVAWRRDGSELFFQRLNRLQNRLELKAADPATGEARTILVEEEKCFINLHDDFRQLADNERFVWSSERTGWKHLYLYDYSGRLVCPLTSGEWEAESLALVDEKDGWVYFTIADNSGLDTQFGRVRLDGRKLARLTTELGTHSVSVDPAGRYCLDSFSSLTQPPVVDLRQADGRLLRRLASTSVDKVKELGLREPEVLKLKAADGSTDVFGILFKPADFSIDKKYPVYVQVYGGPAHRNSNSYQTAGPKARLAQLGYIVWELDGRGTTRRGKAFLTETYLRFGQVDVDDQAAGVRQVSELPYVDRSRVGMTGGSYGGYMTCLSLLRYPEVYAAGLAASSVTDWRGYDSIYTERYMGLPEQNMAGYEKGSAMTYAKNLAGRLLLVHGTIDNNVHLGNTIQLIDALQKEGKNFEVMVYPENRHGIRGFNAEHLGRLRMEFFLRNLTPENWQESLKTVWPQKQGK